MCDTSSVKETVSELLSYLDTADMNLKEELVLKIAILAERYRVEDQWYVDVVLALVKSAGDHVSEEIWYRVVQIVTNEGDALQAYAAKAVWEALENERMPHRTLVKIAGYILGEFGHTIAEMPGSSAEDQLRVLHEQFMQAEPDTKALLLNTYAKLSHAYGEISASVGDVLRASATAMDQEVQQRSVEYLALGGAGLVGVKGQVLEMMPHFTERESIVQKTLSKSQADANAMPAKMGGGADGENGGESEGGPRMGGVSVNAPPPPPPDAIPNLLGDDDPPAATGADPLADDLLGGLGGLGLGGGAAAPPAAPTSAADDLLGLGAPAAPSAPPAGGGSATDDLLGALGGGAPAAPAAPAAGGSSAALSALAVRNDGVLHEDGVVQIGVKMEFQAHQGRLALFFGNKAAAPLNNVSTSFSPQPALQLQPGPLAATIGPRQQQSQVILVQCGGGYADPPQVKVSFDGPAGPTQLILPLPLPPTKFNSPLQVSGADFFAKWKGYDGHETQVVFKLTAVPLAEPTVEKAMAGGLGFAVLKGVDPNTANFVAAGKLTSATGADGTLLVRLEVNPAAGMCRVSVRSPSDPLHAAVAKIIASQLGTPA